MKIHCPPSGFKKTAVKEETNLLERDPLSISTTHPKWSIPDEVVDEMLAVFREEEAVCHE